MGACCCLRLIGAPRDGGGMRRLLASPQGAKKAESRNSGVNGGAADGAYHKSSAAVTLVSTLCVSCAANAAKTETARRVIPRL